MRAAIPFALFALLATAATNWDAAGNAWWKNVEYLASDDLQGRNVGSPGFDKAANYVATQFEKTGLKPAGTGNYFQPVEFSETALDATKSSLGLVRDGNITPLAIP